MITDQMRERQPALVELCQRYVVTRLEIFGSAANGRFDSGYSDVDFLIDLGLHPAVSRFEQYFGLQEALQALVGRPVDLVMVDALQSLFHRQRKPGPTTALCNLERRST